MSLSFNRVVFFAVRLTAEKKITAIGELPVKAYLHIKGSGSAGGARYPSHVFSSFYSFACHCARGKQN